MIGASAPLIAYYLKGQDKHVYAKYVEAMADEIARMRVRIAELEGELAHSILDATAHLVDAKAKAEQEVADLASAIERLPE